MHDKISKLVIVGGGTAGWMTAALLKRVLAQTVDIELVESSDIGIIGVGEATIPPILLFNQVLGLDEAEFLRETKASIKLAIRFENWRKQGEQYYHTFGAPGRSQAFCHFHHFWTRARQLGDTSSLWDYDLNFLCAEAGKFAKLSRTRPEVMKMAKSLASPGSAEGVVVLFALLAPVLEADRQLYRRLGLAQEFGLIETQYLVE